MFSQQCPPAPLMDFEVPEPVYQSHRGAYISLNWRACFADSVFSRVPSKGCCLQFTHTLTCVYIYTHTHRHIIIYTHTHMLVCMCTQILTHTHAHEHTHTPIGQSQSFLPSPHPRVPVAVPLTLPSAPFWALQASGIGSGVVQVKMKA